MMLDIEYLEQKKAQIISDHVRMYHDTKLSEAEQFIIYQLNFEIKQLKALRGDKEKEK